MTEIEQTIKRAREIMFRARQQDPPEPLSRTSRVYVAIKATALTHKKTLRVLKWYKNRMHLCKIESNGWWVWFWFEPS